MANITLPGAGEPVSVRELANGDNVQSMGLDMGTGTDQRLVFDRGTIPRSIDAGVPVRPIPADFWRVGFARVGSGLQTPDMTLIKTGPGMAVSQSGGNLVITTGTTANSETILRSNRTFRGGLAMRHKMILSQRIANQTFRVELAELQGEDLAYTINSATSVTVTFPTTNPFDSGNVGQFLRLSEISGAAGIPGRYAIASVSGLNVTFTVAGWPASGSGTLTLYGHNNIWTEYSGTTATNATIDGAREGWASGNTTATIQTTASPGHVMQVTTDTLSAAWADALVASNTAPQWTERGNRIENIPDDDADLYIFIVVQNGSTAPASTTTMTLGFAMCEMQGRQKIRIATSDQSGATQALPVNVRNSISLGSNTPTLAAGTNLAGDVGLQYRGNNTGAASATPVTSPATPAGQSIKGSAGRLVGYHFHNAATTRRFLKFFNATSVTMGTTGATFEVALEPNQSVTISLPGGIGFATGIQIAVTAARGLTDNTATGLAAGDVTGFVAFA
jgi:hypothetical protein